VLVCVSMQWAEVRLVRSAWEIALGMARMIYFCPGMMVKMSMGKRRMFEEEE